MKAAVVAAWPVVDRVVAQNGVLPSDLRRVNLAEVPERINGCLMPVVVSLDESYVAAENTHAILLRLRQREVTQDVQLIVALDERVDIV